MEAVICISDIGLLCNVIYEYCTLPSNHPLAFNTLTCAEFYFALAFTIALIFSFPFLPFHFFPYSSLPLFNPSRGSGERPSKLGRSPISKHILVHFEVKSGTFHCIKDLFTANGKAKDRRKCTCFCSGKINP